MNKPIFDKALTGEKTELDAIIDGTVLGIPQEASSDAAKSSKAAGAQVESGPGILPIADLPQDERDGKRSIGAFLTEQAAAAGGASVHAAHDANGSERDRSQALDLQSSPARSDQAFAHDVVVGHAADKAIHASDSGDQPHKFHVEPSLALDSPIVVDAPDSGADTMNGLTPSPTATPKYFRVDGSTDGDYINYQFKTLPSGYDGFIIYGDAGWIGRGGNDLIIGSNFGDYLSGDDANDTLIGGKGNDTFDGGNGADIVDYGGESGGTKRVVVNLGVSDAVDQVTFAVVKASTATDTWGDTDKFVVGTIEKVIGTNKNDYFTAFGRGENYYIDGNSGADIISGGDGNDTLVGGSGADLIYGSGGSDEIYGSVLTGTDGSVDSIHGGDGDDSIQGGAEDYIWGDAGNNYLILGHVYYDVQVKVTFQVVNGINVGVANHEVWTDNLRDVSWIEAGAGNDTLTGATWSVYFNGGAGDDLLTGSTTNDTLNGGEGFDSFLGTAGSDVLDGGAGGSLVDYIGLGTSIVLNLTSGFAEKFNGGTDSLWSVWHAYGSNYGDHLIGQGGDNYLNGRWGNDTIDGLDGNDELHGDFGDDQLNGGLGGDVLAGDDGNDTLDGGVGADIMVGGTGDDVYYVDDAGDVVIEDNPAGGIDTVHTNYTYSINTANGQYIENLYAEGSNAIDLTGNTSANHLVGNTAGNILDGGVGADILEGGGGFDKLLGGSEADLLVGGEGNDTLDGGTGADVMYGNDGDDTYIIDNLQDQVYEDHLGLSGGNDTVVLRVKNYDLRKIDWTKFEFNKVVFDGGTFNYAPTNPTIDVSSALQADENTGSTAAPVLVATVTSTDKGNLGPLNYHLVNDFNGAFTIDPTSGKIYQVKQFDYETAGTKYFDLQVYAEQTPGQPDPAALKSDLTTVRIAIKDVNEKPTGLDYGTVSANEKTGVGVPFSNAPVVSDQDANQTFRFDLVDSKGNVLDDKGMFDIDHATGKLSVGRALLQDVNDPTPVHVLVKVTDGGGLSWTQDVTVTINPAENLKPNAPVVQGTLVPLKENATGVAATVIASDDGNGGPLIYKIANTYNGLFGVTTVGNAGQIDLLQKIDYEHATGALTANKLTDKEYKYYAIDVIAEESLGKQQSDPTTLFIRIDNVNEAPTGVSFGIDPNIRAGSTKADALVASASAIDQDADYSGFANNNYAFVDGSGNKVQTLGKFTINQFDGKITTNAPLTQADEGPKSFQVITWDAGNSAMSATSTLAFTIAQDTPPTNLIVSNNRVDEKSGFDAPVGIVSAQDNGGPTGIRYSIIDSTNSFDIDATSGRIFVKANANLDYETKNTYTVKVIATDENGLGRSSAPLDVTINLKDVNEAANVTVAGNVLRVGTTNAGDIVAVATAIDPDTQNSAYRNNKFKFADGTDTNGIYKIAEDGTIRITEALTHDNMGPAILHVMAYDVGGDPALTRIVDYKVVPQSAPWNVHVGASGTATGTDENGKSGDVVATVSASDDRPVGNLQYSIAPNAHFGINQATGQIFITDASGLNFEAGAGPYKVDVTVTDGDVLSTTETITISLTDVNEAAVVSFGTPQHGTIQVGADAGPVNVVQAAAADPDGPASGFTTNKFKFSDGLLADPTTDSTGLFHIDATTGQITTTRALTAADAPGLRTLSVVAYDDSNINNVVVSTVQTFDVTIMAEGNHAPTAPVLHGGTISENLEIGEVVGTVSSTDQDAGDTVTFMFWSEANQTFTSSSDDGLFEIASDGTITLVGQPSVDDPTDFPLKVFAFDNHNATSSSVVSIHVVPFNPVNQAPNGLTFLESGTVVATAPENQRAFEIGHLVGHDPDNQASDLTYTIVGNPSELFTIENGILKLKANAALDYDSLPDNHKFYEVIVHVTDPQGDSVDVTLHIDVLPDPTEPAGFINHNPDTLSFANHTLVASVAEHQTGIVVGGLIATDQDPSDNGLLRYELLNDASHKFMVSETGIVQLLGTASLDASVPEHKITVRVWDAHGGFLDRELTIQVTPEGASNQAPQINAGNTSWTINDVATVAPFATLVISDAEDGAATPAGAITVFIDLKGMNTGDFENLPDVLHLPNGISSFDYVAGLRIVVTGTQAEVTNLLHSLQFNPHDRAAGSPNEQSIFTVIATDSNGVSSTPVDVTVTSVATGTTNHSPDVSLTPTGQDSWQVSDLGTVTPFHDLIFSDQDIGDTLTVSVTWTGADGDMLTPNPADFGVTILPTDPNTNILQISGSQDAVTAFLKAVQFSPNDFPNDPTGTSHPTIFNVTVSDQNGANDSLVVTVDVTTANRAPDSIGFEAGGGTVSEDIGVGHAAGILTAADSNGDGITQYRLDDTSSGLFALQQIGNQWTIVIKGALDFEHAQHMENGVSWYEIKVSAFDGTDWSTSQTLQIFVQDVDNPDNSAPLITIDPNGQTTWTTVDTDTVAPFLSLTFSDSEDHAATPEKFISVEVVFDPANGKLVLPDNFPGVTVGSDPNDVNADPHKLAISGTQADVTAFMKAVIFNPENHLGNEGDHVVSQFDITVFDSTGASALETVTVDSTVTGIDTVDDVAPTIAVDPAHASTPTTDWGPSVSPFGFVTLTDTDSNDLTLTITFDTNEGSLGGFDPALATSSTDPVTHRITWTFAGTIATLTALLHGLTFDATEHAAAGAPITTRFTINLDDHHHGLPTSNHEVTVVTDVRGPVNPPGIDNIYHVNNVGDAFGELVDPVTGGFDTAIVHLVGQQYVLDAGDGIEVLQAALDVASGINVVGNELANTLIGSAFGDTLEGGGGLDVLRGLGGNDTYVVAAKDVVIDESAFGSGGNDTIQFKTNFDAQWSSYTLVQNVENIDASLSTGKVDLTGNELDNLIVGNDSANTLRGEDGNDTLDGGAGTAVDLLVGGIGDDTYRIRHAGDVVVEGANEGNDIVEVFVDGKYRLASNAQVETLKAGDGFTSDGAKGVYLVGNGFSTQILGGAFADTLDGGHDGIGIQHTLNGGAGDDVYYIVHVGATNAESDQIEGEIDGDLNAAKFGAHDVVHLYSGLYADQNAIDAAKAYYLTKGIEEVIVDNGLPPDDGAINAAPTGIDLSGNWVREWVRNDFTIGTLSAVDADGPVGTPSFKFVLGVDGAGKSILSDFDADHRFWIDGDRLKVADGTKLDFEVARSHKFWVQVTDDTGTFQKELTITVRDLLNETGTGTSASEIFKGGSGDDVFDGAGGNDTLVGGFGSDDLTGGAGQDVFRFDKDAISGEFDTIRDFAQGEDQIQLKADVFQLNGLEGGALDDDVFVVGPVATTEAQRIIYDVDSGTLYYDEDGSGEAEALAIAIFDPQNIPNLNKFDFLVI